MRVSLLQIIKEDEQSYIASYSKLQIYSYGKTVYEAISRLKEIIKFYVETANELNIRVEELCDVPQEEVSWQLDDISLPKESWVEIEVKSNFN